MADVKGHTLMLDPDEWDLILDDGGQIVDTAGAYGIAQNVANAVRLFTDDAYYFRDRGIPHFTLDLGRKLNKRMICAEYESAAVGVDGVLSANLLDVTLAHGGVAVTGEQLTDRTLTGDLEIVTGRGGRKCCILIRLQDFTLMIPRQFVRRLLRTGWPLFTKTVR